MTVTGAPQWRGIIEEYREWLPITADTPVITLREGERPSSDPETLRRDRLRRVAEVRRGEPDRIVQGSRDDARDHEGDRGGREAVVCASTGNTSASAAAYAAKAGLTCAVLVPKEDRAR